MQTVHKPCGIHNSDQIYPNYTQSEIHDTNFWTDKKKHLTNCLAPA